MPFEEFKEYLEQEPDAKPLFRVTRSRRTGFLVVRDVAGGVRLRFPPERLDGVLEALTDGPISGEDVALLDALLAKSIELSQKKPRGVHARAGSEKRSWFVNRVKLVSALVYLWLRELRRARGGSDERVRRLQAWVRSRRPAEWARWTTSEKDYATVAAMISKAFSLPGHGINDPLRPFFKGKSAPEVFFRTYIQPRLKEVRCLAAKQPLLLALERSGRSHEMDGRVYVGGSATLGEVLLACDEIVTL
jgi:hypothetical protein